MLMIMIQKERDEKDRNLSSQTGSVWEIPATTPAFSPFYIAVHFLIYNLYGISWPLTDNSIGKLVHSNFNLSEDLFWGEKSKEKWSSPWKRK